MAVNVLAGVTTIGLRFAKGKYISCFIRHILGMDTNHYVVYK